MGPKIIQGGDAEAIMRGIVRNAPGSLQQMPNAPQYLAGNRFRPWGGPENCDAPVFEEHRYARIGGTQVFNPIATGAQVATLVLPETQNLRNFLMLRNASAAAVLYIDFDRNADTASVLRLTANTIVLWDTVVPQDRMTCYSDAAGGILSLWVSTIPGGRC
jgi:hypothetical protein